MKTLATGKNSTAILKLLRVLISTCQSNYGDQNMDDEYIRDIADVIERDVEPGETQSNKEQSPKKKKKGRKGAIAAGQMEKSEKVQ